MTILTDGREVPDDSVLARIFRDVQDSHVSTLRRMMGRQERGDYIEHVARSEGQASADALRAAYLADWEKRKARNDKA